MLDNNSITVDQTNTKYMKEKSMKSLTKKQSEIYNYVTSLEISKRLKELGVKQESLFYWKPEYDGDWKIVNQQYIKYEGTISAFTASELGELLPKVVKNVNDIPMYIEFCFNEAKSKWLGWYKNNKIQSLLAGQIFTDESEANARGKMLIYLLENELIKL